MKELVTTEVATLLRERGYDVTFLEDLLHPVLDRGEAVAIYENAEIGHPEGGALRFFPVASSGDAFEGIPGVPEQLPDFPTEINWRYRLVGVYREIT